MRRELCLKAIKREIAGYIPYEFTMVESKINEFGNKISFRGGLGTQTTMPFGSVEEVKEKCLWLIENMGKNGGFILSPSHVLEPEVPLENILEYLKVIDDNNKEYSNKLKNI